MGVERRRIRRSLKRKEHRACTDSAVDCAKLSTPDATTCCRCLAAHLQVEIIRRLRQDPTNTKLKDAMLIRWAAAWSVA